MLFITQIVTMESELKQYIYLEIHCRKAKMVHIMLSNKISQMSRGMISPAMWYV